MTLKVSGRALCGCRHSCNPQEREKACPFASRELCGETFIANKVSSACHAEETKMLEYWPDMNAWLWLSGSIGSRGWASCAQTLRARLSRIKRASAF